MGPSDPRDLHRFLNAQVGSYDTALAELRSGRKRTHWMWFIFPQLRALGRSPTAHHYGIADRAEAAAYLAHPVLGRRLIEATEALLANPGGDATAILGTPDDLKLRSCMTLFAAVAPEPEVFHHTLAKFYAGRPDQRTLDLLAADE